MRQQIISWNDNFVGSAELIIQYANEFHECDICLVVMETRPDTNSISGVLDVTDISLCIVILRHPVSGNNLLKSHGSVIPGNRILFYIFPSLI